MQFIPRMRANELGKIKQLWLMTHKKMASVLISNFAITEHLSNIKTIHADYLECFFNKIARLGDDSFEYYHYKLDEIPEKIVSHLSDDDKNIFNTLLNDFRNFLPHSSKKKPIIILKLYPMELSLDTRAYILSPIY